MRELSFDGLSSDGTRLVLSGKDGQKYTVAIDERLEAAVRRDRARMSQVEIEQSGVLRPREIQARIRAGATAEDVAAASGLSLEHIRRFEGPVLTERAWVAQQAQTTEVRRPGGDIELGDLVAERLAAAGVDPADIAWDSWRRDDGVWVVIATFPVPPNTHVATWSYDSVSRTMTVADENARVLSDITSEQELRFSAPRPVLTVATLAEDQAGDEYDEDEDDYDEEPEEIGDELAPEETQPEESEPEETQPEETQPEETQPEETQPEETQPDESEPEDAVASAAGSGPTSDAEDVPLFDTPSAPAHHRSGKPAVPSLDDILFGPGPSKE